MVEQKPRHAAGNKRRHGHASVHPRELGVHGNGHQSLGNGRAKRVGEEVQRLHKRLHAHRRLGVGVLETRHRDENLGKTNEDVRRRLDGNVNVVALHDAVNSAGVAARAVVARAAVVDELLHNGRVRQAQRGEPETNGDAENRAQLVTALAQHGVHDSLQNGREDENRDGVKVLHKVVGHAVALHLRRLRDKVARELAVAHPEDRVQHEHLAGLESALQLVDEVVVPHHGALAVLGAPRRLGGVGAAAGNHHANGLEGVGNDLALRRAHNVRAAAGHEDGDTHVEHDEAHEERGPEALVLLHERRGQQREGADVDAPIKDHVDALVRDGGVDNDALAALLRLDGHGAALVLVGNEGGNVGLDAARAEANDDDGHNVAAETSLVAHGREGSDPEEEETNPVDGAEDENRLVLAEVLVGNDGAENGRHCNLLATMTMPPQRFAHVP